MLLENQNRLSCTGCKWELNLVWLLTVTQRFPKLYAQIAGQSRLRLLSYKPSDVCGLNEFHRKCGLKQPEWLFDGVAALRAV